jgi:Protein kinase domain
VSTQTEVGIGTDFVGYRIEARIGRGGMGVVYRAYDLRLKRTVALKLIAPELALDEHFRERFARETELTMALEHPNVVPIHDAGEVDGRLYLAMRLVEGTDLRTLLRAEGRLAPIRALAICRQIANALDAAHAKGLVHRDVKPSNVLLDEDEHLYLADFGLTKRLDDSAHPPEGRSPGTPAYVAPEQIEGGPVDGRADVYSLGCLLYECFTGEAPFLRVSPLAVAWAHLEEGPPRASELNSQLPAALDDVIGKAMAKEPDARYPTCAALIDAAYEALGLRRSPLVHRPRFLLGAAAVLLAALAAVLSFALTTGGQNGGSRPAAFGGANTLVRIDPLTNEVRAVIPVGERPAAVAASGHSVWVYNYGDETVWEIDAATQEVLRRTPLVARPELIADFAGPVLAADPAGAWLIGTDAQGRHALMRIFSGGRGSRVYPLRYEPRAVAVGAGTVWVLGAGRHDAVLRIDPVTGEVVATKVLPTAWRVTGLAFGARAVWVVDPSSATLYRVDVRTLKVASLALLPYAIRPVVAFGSVRIDTSADGGTLYLVDPLKLGEIHFETLWPPDGVVDTSGYGSIWSVNVESGTVIRFDPEAQLPIATTHITRTPPAFFGPPATAIDAGAGAIWVTIARGRSAN